MRWCSVVVFAFVVVPATACSGDEEASKTQAMSPEQLCAKKCELTVAANCPRTPPDFLTSCQALCLSKYTKFPNCTEAIRPLDECAIEKVSYGCDSSGNVSITPTGACAREGAGCIQCTGDFMQCL